ncbi:uncharacterized protein LOC143429174 isoform X1 [Xylocopa sonorina]|uniref:uncharacterized protein LOC143429174 isoform X1 n=1 Tax=Xylocopa sonorina TaxID=1818115 RepID=UPI00403A8789
MFNPVLIKYECTEVEDVNSGDKVNASNNSKYPTFIDEGVDYKYNGLPQFWDRTHLSNEIRPKNEIHGQRNLYHAEGNNLIYMNNCVQTGTVFQANQEGNLSQGNQQCRVDITQKVEQSEYPRNIKPNQMVIISEPISSIKPNCLGKSPKSCSESNIGKKHKCQCEICFKEFGHKSNLFIHMRTHNGERPYKCNQCEKCFTHSGNLAIHMRTHSGERPYGCQICGKMFSHSGNLSTHLRTHSGVKPYKCAVCGKEFRHSGNLSIHERIHSGIKPFQCKVCGKDFYHSGNLTTHMKKHTMNINASINRCENNEKQSICAAVNFNNITPANSFNNLPPIPTTDVKPIPNVNIVPVKNESNDEELTNAIDILTTST